MKKRSAVFLLLASVSAYSQSSFNRVYTLLQTNCATAYCHSGSTPTGGLDLSGTESQVYSAIVEVAPNNAAAAAKGDKYIDKGYPERSFLLRKIAHGLSDDLALSANEGNAMPNGLPKLADHEIELVRQWIIYGAPQTGSAFNYQRLVDYYNPAVGGIQKISRPPAPPAGEGMQIHFGPVFWAPGEELEYFKEFDPRFDQNIEVYKYELYMNSESHHFILRQFDPNEAQSNDDGLQPFNTDGFGRQFINAWQVSTDLELPLGTGFFYDSSTVFDLNFHMKNYHTSQILPGEIYLNVYYRPRGATTVEMKAELIPKLDIFIFPNQTASFTDRVTRSGQTWNIWMLSTHTHKFGIDYDIFLGNSTSASDKIYEGFYDFDYTFNQGFYDWSHPPVRRFNPMLTVNMNSGITHKATYNNTSSNLVTWSFQTTGEMMLIYVQYTTQSVNYKPPVNSSSNGPACNSINLSTDGGMRAYLWSSGDTTQTITVTQSGTYTVTVTDGSGSTYTSDPFPVNVFASPTVDVGSDRQFCDGENAVIDAGAGFTAYAWSTGDITQTLSVSNAGSYSVTVTDANGCTAVDTATVVVSQVATGAITGSLNVLSGDTTGYSVNDNAGSSYVWTVINGTIEAGQGTAAVDVVWGAMGTGNIAVVETNADGCTGDTVSVQVNVGTTSVGTNGQESMAIFPNPASDFIVVQFSNPREEKFQFRMIDITGKVVKEIPALFGKELFISCGRLPKGIYIIELKGEKLMRSKVVIAN